MRKITIISTILIVVAMGQVVLGQSAGDLAFIGWNSDGNDDMVFILLADFSVDTKVYISDDEYNNGWANSEGAISWVVPSGGLLAGTMIEINNSGSDPPTVNTGTVAREDAGFDIANGEEAVYAYTSTDTYNSGTFTFLAAFCNASSFGDFLNGSSLTDGTDAWSWGNKDNWRYTGSTSSTSVGQMKTYLQNSNNWEFTDGSGDQSFTFSFSDFSLPVELSSFTARSERGAVVLEWVTESEIENLGFLLERRSNGGMEEWKEIANYIDNPELQGQGSETGRTEYQFVDNTVEVGKTYDYRLADVSYDGIVEYHSLTVMGVEVAEFPTEFALLLAYPNPFNPATTISYNLIEDGNVTLTIFDINGREVSRLVEETQTAGE
ncbi:MAG: T9SS type A sorting domain-containing protein, partial [Candidatus Marinimicrobia bacterium]|nr:T9SS type A sorting domain-containing protein [Candidatus Neomarinimicrobiota bacterium]